MTTDAPPHNPDAEKAVLGACMVNPEAVEIAAAILQPGDWCRTHHARIWQAIRDVHAAGGAVDFLTVTNALGGDLETVGGPAYVTALTDGMPRSTNVASYAAIVHRCALQRRLAAARDAGQWAVVARIANELEAPAGPATEGDSDDWGVSIGDGDVPNENAAVEVLPGIAWSGTATMIVGSYGSGKTTLVVALAAAATQAGKTILWLGLDNDDPRVRLKQMGGALARFPFTAATRVAAHSLRAIPDLMEQWEPDVIVIDSLRPYMQAAGGNLDNANDAEANLRPWIRAAHDSGAALLVLHHPPHDHIRAAHSGAFAAMVDAILTFTREGDVSTVTPADKVRAGIPAKERSWRLGPDGMTEIDPPAAAPVPADAWLGLEAQARQLLEAGTSVRKLIHELGIPHPGRKYAAFKSWLETVSTVSAPTPGTAETPSVSTVSTNGNAGVSAFPSLKGNAPAGNGSGGNGIGGNGGNDEEHPMSTTRQPWMTDHDFVLAEIGDRFMVPATDHKGMTVHRLGLSAMVEVWRTNMLEGVPTAASVSRGRLVIVAGDEAVAYQSTRAMAEMLDAWSEADPAGRDVWVQAATEQIEKWEAKAA